MPTSDATDDDLPAIVDIYNDAILRTAAVWTSQPVDLDNRRLWRAERLARGYPVIVVRRAGEVVGFGSFGPWRPLEGYRCTVEHSVYVRPDHHGQGIGRALLAELIERARAGSHHAMVAGIEAENTASIRLHERLGFVPVARLDEVGTKFGRWLDLVYMQRLLDPDQAAPPA